MTITTNPSRDEYTSSPGQTVFNYTFKIYENTDLNVYVTPEGQEANDATDIVTNYTVDSNTIGDDAGGFITFDSPLNDGDLVTIVSDIPTDRTTDYQANGDFIPQTVNNDFDRTVSLVKQVENLATRTIQFQESQQSATGITLPAPNPGDILQWNDAGDGFENTDGSGILGIDQAVIDAEAARDASEGFADDSATSAASSFDSATDSSDSALLSQAWAESATEPGDPGTKSSKTWAGESAASAQEAADEVASIDKVDLKSGRKNYIINGGFDVWQRGTSFSSVGFAADRWYVSSSGYDRTRSTDAPDGFSYSMRSTRTAASSHFNSTYVELPRIGNAGVFVSGGRFTVSGWVKGDSGNTFYADLAFSSGSGGVNETPFSRDEVALLLTGAWQKFSFTFTVDQTPSGAANSVRVVLGYINSTANSSVYFTGVQLEKGSYATDFEYRPIGEELALCQRYYINSEGNTPIRYRYKTPSATTNIALGSTAFPVTMRTSLPTITLENESTTNASSPRVRTQTDKNIIVEWDELSASTITVNCGYTADAEL